MTKLDDVKAAIAHMPTTKCEQLYILKWFLSTHDLMEEALALYQAVLEKQKVMLVPVNPSDDMCIKGDESMESLLFLPTSPQDIEDNRKAYKAMTAAVDTEALTKEVINGKCS